MVATWGPGAPGMAARGTWFASCPWCPVITGLGRDAQAVRLLSAVDA